MDLLQVLKEAVAREASDILFSAGAPVTYHIHGELIPRDEDGVLTPDETENLIYQMMTQVQAKEFEKTRDMDLGFHVPDLARFRVNVFRQRGTAAAVFRLVPLRVPHFSEIGISDRLLMQMLNTTNGLILVTGPTGAGKSTTIASFLDYLNNEGDTRRHIITIEDPIEFLLPSNLCVVDQREIGADTNGYPIGLRSALRQMPHIIFVGEMRDRDTMEIALTAAETGNVVISTLSTQSAAKTVNRIIDVFPLEHQAEIRTRLALTLKVVVAQVLLRRIDRPGRVAAREILFTNNAISNLIREGKIHQLNNAIAGGAHEGMVLLDDVLLELYHEGIVDAASVLVRLEDPEKIRQLRGSS
jgi:twitching motility protein PilT